MEEYEKGSSNDDEIESSDGVLESEHLEAIYGNQKIIDALDLDKGVILGNEQAVIINLFSYK